MKFVFGLFSVIAFAASVHAQQGVGQGEIIGRMPETTPTTDRITQLFSVEMGRLQPKSVMASNGDYNFEYNSDSLSAPMVEVGWSIRLLSLGPVGALSFSEGLGYANFSGPGTSTSTGTSGVTSTSQDLHINLLSFDSRLVYTADWFPWKMLIPFASAGYQYTFFNQTGSSDLDSVQGGVGNLVYGAGLRFWVNRGQFTTGNFESRYEHIPFYLTARYNHISTNGQTMDLASDSYFGGIEVGL